MQNRRSTSRWQINKPVSIKFEGAVAFADCLLKDINLKGLQIVMGLKLAVDTHTKFSLVLSKEYSLECEAWVAWHKSIDTYNIYGLYFTKLKDIDKDKIYKFVYQNVPEEISKRLRRDILQKEGGVNMEDRRIFQRFDIRFPVKLLDLNSGQEVNAQTSDISAKGMGVRLKQNIAAQTPLEAWLSIPDRGEALYTRGNVVWSKPEGAGEYRLGIDLEKADLMGLSRILRV